MIKAIILACLLLASDSYSMEYPWNLESDKAEITKPEISKAHAMLGVKVVYSYLQENEKIVSLLVDRFMVKNREPMQITLPDSEKYPFIIFLVEVSMNEFDDIAIPLNSKSNPSSNTRYLRIMSIGVDEYERTSTLEIIIRSDNVSLYVIRYFIENEWNS